MNIPSGSRALVPMHPDPSMRSTHHDLSMRSMAICMFAGKLPEPDKVLFWRGLTSRNVGGRKTFRVPLRDDAELLRLWEGPRLWNVLVTPLADSAYPAVLDASEASIGPLLS